MLVSFTQLFSGVLRIRICGTVFANTLSQGLTEFAPDAPFNLVHHSVPAIWMLLPVMQEGIIHTYVLVSPTTKLDKGRLNALQV
jgi:hypothetical protein